MDNKFKEIDFEALGKFLVGDEPKDEKEAQFFKENNEKFMEAYQEYRNGEK